MADGTTHEALLRQIGSADALLAYFQGKEDHIAGLRQIRFKVLRDDANPTVAFVAGATLETATISHTAVYDSAFLEDETELFIIWAAQARLTSPGDGTAVANLLLTDENNNLITNVEYVAHSTTATGYDYIRGSVGGFVKTTKAANKANFTLNQKVYITGTDAGSSCSVDNMDLFIMEEKNG